MRWGKESERFFIRRGRGEPMPGALRLLSGGRASGYEYRIDNPICARVLRAGRLAAVSRPDVELGSAVCPGAAAGVRSQTVSVARVRYRSEDRAADRRRLRLAPQRQDQDIRQLWRVLRHDEDEPGARLVR